MKGDFSRFTHKPEKHYTSVLKQQGRVDLDADWNEQASIQEYLNEEGLKDMIGRTGVPSRFSGFNISKKHTDNEYINFYIDPGRIYVDGILCELEKRSTYISQPDLPHPEKIELATSPRIDLIYLDVWKRHITAIEDASIRETALGGPDTANRVKTIWQVKVLKDISYDHETGSDLCSIPKWNDLTSPAWGKKGWGKISVKLSASKPEEKPCTIDSEGGYRGRENRLYRVEIHSGGTIRAGSASNSDTQPTFKWSRDNGAVVFPIQELDSLDARRLKLKRLGKDRFLSLHRGDWVEVLDDARELAGEPGIVAEVTEDIDEEQLIITLGKEVSDTDITGGHAKLRRWDQMEDAIRIIPGTPVDLEAGLQVQFSTGKVKTGDFWIFTARSNGEVELLNQVPAMGIEHHYCILALIIWKNDGSKLKAEVLDCRRTFPSLTDLTCLYYVGGDGQEAMPGYMLKQPIQVGISNGSQPLKGPQVMGMNVVFKIIDGDDEGKLSGSTEETPGSKSKIIPVGKDGIAKCHWKLGKEPISQKVEARLIDACGKHVHLPIIFSANLSIASEVAYDEPRCRHMKAQNVRDALNILCNNYGLHYVGGDGQEGLPGGMLDHPLRVRASNGIWPEADAKVTFKVESGEGSLSKPEAGPGNGSSSECQATTDKDGIAEVWWTLGGSGIQRVKASLHKAPTMPIFFNAGFKAIGGSGCYIPVGGQSAYKELADALNALVIKNSDVCLCLLPGNYTLPEGGWTLNRQNARVKIVGSGLGSVIDLKKTTMLMKGLASISLKDLKIDAGNLNHDGLVLKDCGQIDIESCCLTGDAAAANPCIVLQKKVPTTKIGKGEDIRLMQGVYIKRAGSDDLRFYIYKLIDQPGVYRIRGAAAGTVNGKSNLKESSFTWNPQNYAGFFYDIDEDIGTETLTAMIDDEENKLSVEYKTSIHTKKFKFDDWGTYSAIGFLAEEYFAGYLDTPETDDGILFEESDDKNVLSDEQLLQILIDNDDEITVTSGTPLDMEEGYELAIKSIDIDGNKVYLELSKDGAVVDSKVISPSAANAGMKDKTYTYKMDIGDSKNVVIIAAHFKNAFRGADQNLATIDGLWQLSDTPKDVSKNTEYDKMTIQTVTANSIMMNNEGNYITLSKNEDITLMPGVSIKTADDDALRFYIYKDIIIEGEEPQEHKIRGAVAGIVNGKSNLKNNSFTWNPQNFAGFFYDIDADAGTEMLTAAINEMNDLSVKYETCSYTRKFEFENWGSYSAIGFLAEAYFAGYLDTPRTDDDILFEESDDENVLSDEQLLQILVNNDDEITVTSGKPLVLEEGYELAIKSIDIDGNKVCLELHKDGAAVDSKLISPSAANAGMKDKTYTYKMDIGDSKDVVIIAAHFKNAFRGADQNLATVDGLWQLSDTSIDVSEGTEYDQLKIISKLQANGALLKISNARRIQIENNDIEVKSLSVTPKPQMITDEKAFPELNEVVKERGSVNFDSVASAFIDNLKSMSSYDKIEFRSRLKNAIERNKTAMKRIDLGRYNTLIEATTEDDIIKEKVIDALRDILAYEADEISLASALVISDAKADTIIDKNRIKGTISIYGIPTSERLIQADLENIINLLNFTSPGKVLHLRGNQMGRLVIGDRMTEMIKKGSETEYKIDGAFQSSFFSENVIKSANNQIVSDHLSFCTNVFESDKQDAGMAISNSAIFMGNYTRDKIKLFSLSNLLNKEAGNLNLDIQWVQ